MCLHQRDVITSPLEKNIFSLLCVCVCTLALVLYQKDIQCSRHLQLTWLRLEKWEERLKKREY